MAACTLLRTTVVVLVCMSFALSVCFGRIDRLASLHSACEVQLARADEERSRRGRKHRRTAAADTDAAAVLRSRVAALEAAAAEKDQLVDSLRKSRLQAEADLRAARDALEAKRGPAQRADATKLALVTSRWERTASRLQVASRQLLLAEFGARAQRLVDLRVRLPDASEHRMRLRLAPDELMPTTVLYFLRQVRDGVWDGATFHRNAGHVLQAGPAGNRGRMATLAKARGEPDLQVPFQEYSARFPHRELSLGLAGRPGGPDFYISTRDNTELHGPGSQSADAAIIGEADSCFASVVEGVAAVDAMRGVAGQGGFGALPRPIEIVSMQLAPTPAA